MIAIASRATAALGVALCAALAGGDVNPEARVVFRSGAIEAGLNRRAYSPVIPAARVIEIDNKKRGKVALVFFTMRACPFCFGGGVESGGDGGVHIFMCLVFVFLVWWGDLGNLDDRRQQTDAVHVYKVFLQAGNGEPMAGAIPRGDVVFRVLTRCAAHTQHIVRIVKVAVREGAEVEGWNVSFHKGQQ